MSKQAFEWDEGSDVNPEEYRKGMSTIRDWPLQPGAEIPNMLDQFVDAPRKLNDLSLPLQF